MAQPLVRPAPVLAAVALLLSLSACWGFGGGPPLAAGFESGCGDTPDPAEARVACGRALNRLDPEDDDTALVRARLHSQRGEAALLAGDPAAALRDHRRAIALDPAPALHWSRRGWARFELGERRAAFKDFEAALERDPKNRSALLGRGATTLALSAPARAVPDLEAVLAIAPGLTYARLLYARALAQLGRSGEAAAAYNQVLTLEPDNLDAMLERARLREGYDREAARVDYDLAVSRAADAGPAYAARGRFHDRIGEREAAEADFERAYALGVREEWLRLRLARRAR